VYNKYAEVLLVHAVHRTFTSFSVDIIVTSLIKKEYIFYKANTRALVWKTETELFSC